MTEILNHLGQPVGAPIADWQIVPLPPRSPMQGRFCAVEPVQVDQHAADLFEAFRLDKQDQIWTYLPYGPFATEQELKGWMTAACLGRDPLFYVIVDNTTGKAVGMASYLRLQPAVGVIEVGHINYSPLLQRTPIATEAMCLMMRRVFSELGYRRYEWKCDALNAASRRAAERLGFQFDGVFRQASIYKGRNRDTAWYSILDCDWPGLEKAYKQWLGPENLDTSGQQKLPLGDIINRFRSDIQKSV